MALPQPNAPLTAEDYPQWEAGQPEKHKYVRGETVAMGGASRRHVTISLNVASALEGTPCRACMADMKVHAAENEAYFYPDVLVTCDPADHRADLLMRAPTLIVEVLSPATAACHRGDKFAAYRRIPSLRDFVLIDPDLRRIEHYRHRGDIGWDIITFEPGDTAQRASVELELPIADVYFKAGVECSA